MNGLSRSAGDISDTNSPFEETEVLLGVRPFKYGFTNWKYRDWDCVTHIFSCHLLYEAEVSKLIPGIVGLQDEL